MPRKRGLCGRGCVGAGVGCEDAARHRGTVLRLVARDSVVAQPIADHLRAQAKAALVVAGEHAYGRQLDQQAHRCRAAMRR
jgi:hypothetical protein